MSNYAGPLSGKGRRALTRADVEERLQQVGGSAHLNLAGEDLSKANLHSMILVGSIFINADLSGTDLRRVYLSGADLSRANLSGADLSEADLSRANLSDANLSDTILSGANLSEADLSGVNLRGAYLIGANLSGAYLIGANSSGANLINANLSGAKLSSTNLGGADLSRANLSGVDLNKADLSGADLSRANLSGASLIDAKLGKVNLGEANLSGTFLRRADLRGADLHRAKLNSADLIDAKLKGADLSGADLGGASLFDAELSGAKLNRTNISGAYLSRAKLRGTDLSKAKLRGTDLSDTILSGANLSEADLRGTDLSRADLREANLSGAKFLGVIGFSLDNLPTTPGLSLRVVEEPLTLQHLSETLETFLALYTKLWLLQQQRFNDFVRYSTARDRDLEAEASLPIAKMTYNSPWEGKINLDLSPKAVVDALQTVVEMVAHFRIRKEAAEATLHAEQLNNQLTQEKLKQERLTTIERAFGTLEQGSALLDKLSPGLTDEQKAFALQSLAKEVLHLASDTTLELTLIPPSQETHAPAESTLPQVTQVEETASGTSIVGAEEKRA